MKDVLESRQREHDGERDGGENKEVYTLAARSPRAGESNSARQAGLSLTAELPQRTSHRHEAAACAQHFHLGSDWQGRTTLRAVLGRNWAQ